MVGNPAAPAPAAPAVLTVLGSAAVQAAAAPPRMRHWYNADLQTRVLVVRSYISAFSSFGFTINAVMDVAARSLVLHNASAARDFDGYAVAAAGIGLTGALLGIPTNAFKSAAGWGSRLNVTKANFPPRWFGRTNNKLAWAGSRFGIVQGLTTRRER